MKCEADLLHLPIYEALAEVNKILLPVVMAEKGNQAATVEVVINDFYACATTLFTYCGRDGGCSILDYIRNNNIASCLPGVTVVFKPEVALHQ